MPLRCTLEIGERLVTESAGGPLETEYALFDPGNIELQQDGPGIIREVGYRTTAAEARRRLAELGVTAELANEAAEAMQPTLAQVYARGPSVRRVTQLLGAAELFDARSYEAGARVYVGTWLDLLPLAKDSKVLRATTAIQALFYAALLAEASDNTRVFLSTVDYTRDRRPGERTYRRVPLDHATALPDAFTALAAHAPPLDPNKQGPARADLLDIVNRRAETCGNAEARERLATLACAIIAREPPPRGPLADSEIWALDTQLSNGDSAGVIEKIDIIEKARGRLPATTYLRAKAALLLGTEKPQVVAERVSALAQAMTAFFELELLAAEAWAKAGDSRRSRAFSRDLVENPNAPDELRVRALELLEAKSSMQLSAVLANVASSRSSAQIPAVNPPVAASGAAAAKPAAAPTAAPAPAPATAAAPAAAPAAAVPRPASIRPVSRPPSARPPRPDARREVEARDEDDGPDTAIEPAPIVGIAASPEHADEPTLKDRPAASQPPPRPVDAPPPPRVPTMETPARPRTASTPPDRVEVVNVERLAASTSSAPPPPAAWNNPAARGNASTLASVGNPLMRGMSRPPFATESGPMMMPPTPPPPRMIGAQSELAESLSLPPGLHGQPPPRGDLPTNPIDARIAFTYMSRELGREYRIKHKLELRTDVPSIEAMQRVLREAISDPSNITPEQMDEVKRHGALLSEILARQLGAYWVDLGPSELGYWAMLVPPQTRVWPFGRALRFVHMGHKERDLVSYYLELESRARR